MNHVLKVIVNGKEIERSGEYVKMQFYTFL